MPLLSEHERSGSVGMLKVGMYVFDVARYHNCHPSTIQCLRDCYQATGTVKEIDKGLVSQEWRPALRCALSRLCIDDIRSGRLQSVPDEL